MRSIKQQPILNDDGTPRRKYELDEQDDSKKALLATIGLLFANAFILVKNVLFWDEATKDQVAPAAKPKEGGEIAGAQNELAFELIDGGSKPPGEEYVEEEIGSSGFYNVSFSVSTPLYIGYSDATIRLRSSSGLAEAGNDNEALYGASPGKPIVLPPNDGGITLPGSGSGSGPGSGSGSGSGSGTGGNGSSGGSGSGGTGSGGTDDDDDADDDDDTTTGPPHRSNRLPVVAGPVILGSLLMNNTAVIALSDLLRNASDPDGDVLSVRDLRPSSGSLNVTESGTWVFTPDYNDTTDVTFVFAVSDGQGSVSQTAFLDLYSTGPAIITGTEGCDTLVGTPQNDVIDGLGGDDIIIGREGDDVIYGGCGNDRIVAGAGSDTVYGGDGDDVIFAGEGDDAVFGGKGNDILFGEDGSDVLVGEDGNDTASGGAGDDSLAGGHGNDLLRGDEGHDFADGGDGEDKIEGGEGNDVILAGAGDDLASGGGGDDVFISGAGDGNDTYDAGEGIDAYDASSSFTAVFINLFAGTAYGSEIGCDSIVGFENVMAGYSADTLFGGAGDNALRGAGGDDIIAGGDGHDTLDGGTGDDTIKGEEGNDTITAGADQDDASGGTGDDVFIVIAGDGDDVFDGGEGHDTYDASDTSYGAVINLITGTVNGMDVGSDRLQHIENVIAGSGDDTIIADDALNFFTGGAGDDIFVFGSVAAIGKGSGSRDKILDFAVGDRIDLDDISEDFAADVNAAFQDESIRRFVLIGSQDPFTRPGQMRFKYDDIDNKQITVLEGNVNDNPDVDFELEIAGRYELRDEDFYRT